MVQEKKIESYHTRFGTCPIEVWLDLLALRVQATIRIRLRRVARGNLGNVKALGDGVHEMKFKLKGFPAYRIYFGNDSDSLILLLCGGDKSKQRNDILKAKGYWNDYKERKKTEQ